LCKEIIKVGITRHPNLTVLLREKDIEKQPSPIQSRLYNKDLFYRAPLNIYKKKN